MFPIHTVLHPTDFSEHSGRAFMLACALARDYGARLVVLHVKPPPEIAFGEMAVVPPEPPEVREALCEELTRVKPSDPAIRVEHWLRDGDASDGIVRAARESKCDLVVMGTHGRTGLGRLLLGSVAEAVLRRAPCPVLTVKTPPAVRAPEPGVAAVTTA